jgi:hypothetical protein
MLDIQGKAATTSHHSLTSFDPPVPSTSMLTTSAISNTFVNECELRNEKKPG